MRLPRDVSGRDLARALAHVGYGVTRRSGSHIRLTTTLGGEHHADHDTLRVGTLAAILDDVASHLGRGREDLAVELFGS